MEKFISILFALFCFGTAFVSGNLLGVGMWFWVILSTGVFVAISAFIPVLAILGAFLAGLLAVISCGAVLLGLVAATIGGSFKLEGAEAMLLSLFFGIAITGFYLTILYKRRSNRIEV